MTHYELTKAIYKGSFFECIEQMTLSEIRYLHSIVRTAVEEKIHLIEAQGDGEIVQRLREESYVK